MEEKCKWRLDNNSEMGGGVEEKRDGVIAVKSRVIRQPDGQEIRQTIRASEEI